MSRTTVFYVDDDPDDLEIFDTVLADLGYDVSIFIDGNVMLESLENPPPAASIVFVDLNMPLIDGFEVIKTIRKSSSYSTLPLVVFSTGSDPKDVEKSKVAGANLYLQKPSDFIQLKKALDCILTIHWETFDGSFLYGARY